MKTLLAIISATLLAVGALAPIPVSATDGQARTAPAPAATALRFTRVTVGSHFSCGLSRAGTIICWGNNSFGQSDPPSGRFAQVSAGGWSQCCSQIGAFACALRATGSSGSPLTCWGNIPKPPAGNFIRVSAALGASYACALSPSGRITCWGQDYQAKPPPGVFTQVSAGGDNNVAVNDGFGCALKRNGRPVCWAGEYGGAPGPVPSGIFTQVAVGTNYSGASDQKYACGLTRSKKIICWGHFPPGNTPMGSFTQVSVQGSSICGLLTSGRAICWGTHGNQAVRALGTFSQISGNCGVRRDGSTTCWSLDTGTSNTSPTEIAQISAGGGSSSEGGATACGLQMSGAIVCWGSFDIYGLPSFAKGPYIEVDTGGGFDEAIACGLRPHGQVKCWGRGQARVTASIPSVRFTHIAVGADFACGLRPGGKIQCWGEIGGTSLSSIKGQFAQISAGGDNLCALTSKGIASCWGMGSARRGVPSGRFSGVSAGADFACGVRTTGKVICWGDTSQGNLYPPGGSRFSQVSAGSYYACGLKLDHGIVCWGPGGDDATKPPPGLFTGVSAGVDVTCAIRPDRGFTCWRGMSVVYPGGTPLGA